MYNGRLKKGGYYVNLQRELVREVYDIRGDTHYWITYQLRDGTPTGDSLSAPSYVFRQWVDREATHDEVARLKGGVAHRKVDDANDPIIKALRAATDEQLLDEVRRRNLTV